MWEWEAWDTCSCLVLIPSASKLSRTVPIASAAPEMTTLTGPLMAATATLSV